VTERAPGVDLSPAQERKLTRWRRLVMGCLWGAAAALAAEGVLLVWPGVGRTAKLVGAAVFVELAISTAVLGALGRCPACNFSFEAPPGRLLPERCGRCGAVLETRRNQ
jgi:hypothetical protein